MTGVSGYEHVDAHSLPEGCEVVDGNAVNMCPPEWLGASKLPPSNQVAEQHVLGCLLAGLAALPTIVATGLEPKHFVDPIHRLIYGQIERCHAQGSFLIAGETSMGGYHLGGRQVRDGLNDNADLLSEVGGIAYLDRITLAAHLDVDPAACARSIKDCWMRRYAIDVAEDLSALAENLSRFAFEGHPALSCEIVVEHARDCAALAFVRVLGSDRPAIR